MEPTIAIYNFTEQDFEAFCANGAAAGFEHAGVGFMGTYLPLPLENLSDDDFEYVRSHVNGAGMDIVAIYGGVNLLGDDGVELLTAKLHGAARFGVHVLDTGSFGFADKTPEQIAADTRTFVERIRRCADVADGLDITICLETHGGYTGTADTCLQAMADINHDRVRLAYDPANFIYYEGARPEERIEELVPFIGHTHLKDARGGKGVADFPLIGEGETDYEFLLPKLWELGYRGSYTLERAPGETTEERAASMAAAYRLVSRLLKA